MEFFSLLVLIPMMMLASGSSGTDSKTQGLATSSGLEGPIETGAPSIIVGDSGTSIRPPVDRRLSMQVVSYTDGRSPASTADRGRETRYVEVIVQAP